MRAVLAALLLVPLAGCMSGPTDSNDAIPQADALPSTLDVDLHDYVLNITMPEGQPTMLVALNVTKDMWVRPFVHAGLGSQPGPAQEDPTFWTLCPSTKSTGLPTDARYTVIPFWNQEGALVPAYERLMDWAEFNDTETYPCIAPPVTAAKTAYFAAEEPRDEELILLIATKTDASPAKPEPTMPPGFNLLVGIGTRPCGYWYCPPEAEIAAAPLLRGGKVASAEQSTVEQGQTCSWCGFEFQDDRTVVGPFGVGTVTLSRAQQAMPGILFVVSWTGIDGHTRITVDSTDVGEAIRTSCESFDGYAQVDLLRQTRGSGEVIIELSMEGQGHWGGSMLEFPIDLAAAGLTLEPATTGFDTPGLVTNDAPGTCPGASWE